MKHGNELLLVSSLCCFGCAMSPSAYDELASEVSKRNAARHEAAMERFETDGYEWAVDVALMALLDEDGTEQCRSARDTSGAPAPGTARVRVVAPNPAGGPSVPRTEIDVPLDEACEFFVGRGDRLFGVDADGAPTELLRSPLPVARDPAGELVWVEVVRDVLSERTVLVEQTCNEMPSPGPEPFGRPPAPVSVIPPPAPTRRVRVAVEHEALDYECTDIVQ